MGPIATTPPNNNNNNNNNGGLLHTAVSYLPFRGTSIVPTTSVVVNNDDDDVGVGQSSSPTSTSSSTTTLATVGFGSCNIHAYDQQYWNVVNRVLGFESDLHFNNDAVPTPTMSSSSSSPPPPPADAFVWLGDVVYIDNTQRLMRGEEQQQRQKDSAKTSTTTVSDEEDAKVAGGENDMRSREYYWGNVSPVDAAHRAYSSMMNVSLPYAAFVRSMGGHSDQHTPTAATTTNPSHRRPRLPVMLRDGVGIGASGGGATTTTTEEVDERSSTNGVNDVDQALPAVVPNRIVGVWDDHDFGVNDGGKEFPFRVATQELFTDFIAFDGITPKQTNIKDRDTTIRNPPSSSSTNHRQWQRSEREGTYAFYTIDADPSSSTVPSPSPSSHTTSHYNLSDHYQHAFCIVLLDARTFRDPMLANRTGDVLGDRQWRWLDRVLAYVGDNSQGDEVGAPQNRHRQRCAATLIGSGIQLLSAEKPTEQWSNFPAARDKLLAKMRAHVVNRAVFISGDVHLMEIMKDSSLDTGRATDVLGYPIIDFTSSGLTHSTGHGLHSMVGWLHVVVGEWIIKRLLHPVLEWVVLPLLQHSSSSSSSPFSLQSSTPSSEDTIKGSSSGIATYFYDFLFEHILFDVPRVRVSHYFGANVGAVSLQVSWAEDRTEGGGAERSAGAAQQQPTLELRLAGYALNLDEIHPLTTTPAATSNVEGEEVVVVPRGRFAAYRYGTQHPEVAAAAAVSGSKLGGKRLKYVRENDEVVFSGSSHPHHHHHPSLHNVMSYVQPISELQIKPTSTSGTVPTTTTTTTTKAYIDTPRWFVKELIFSIQRAEWTSLILPRHYKQPASILLSTLCIILLIGWAGKVCVWRPISRRIYRGMFHKIKKDD